MTGTVELDPDGQHLLIRFPYREDLVAAVKDLQGRRWDPKHKLWRVPASQAEQVFAQLSRHLFEFAPEIMSLLAGTLGTTAPVPKPRGPVPAPSAGPGAGLVANEAPPALSISALNARVRDALRQAFAGAFWVVGEIVDFDKSAGRQHRFFQLIEKASNEPRPIAAVEVALFANTAERLLPMLASGDTPLVLRDGLEIRALVKVDLYPQSGRFQIVVQDIDPSFTLGKLALSRERILRELAQLGLAQRNRLLGFPVPTLRIGVLTSPDADGWNDFLRHLQESHCGFEVTLFPVKVQGIDLKPTLLAGLHWFADRAEQFDVLCIVRGGGSRTDLAWFDDRDVALAVARHPLKVLIGIGHQRDQSVLDAIAHSEKTPTAVAELLVRGIESARTGLAEQAARLHADVQRRLAELGGDLRDRAHDVAAAANRAVTRARTALATQGRALQTAHRFRLQAERDALRQTQVALQQQVAHRCERAAAELERQTVRQRLLDPMRVLARGFALVRDAAGRVVPAVERLAPGSSLTVQFRDGRATAHIDHIQKAQP